MNNWYFVTTKDLGENPIIRPVPYGEYMDPAIVLAPTIPQCLFGIGELKYTRVDEEYIKRDAPFRAYQLNDPRKLSPIPQIRMYDYYFTEEHRIFVPAQFKFVEIVEEKLVNRVDDILNDYYTVKDRWESVRMYYGE